MSITSVKTWYEENLKGKLPHEQIIILEKLNEQIDSLESQILNGDTCLEKPDYVTQIKALWECKLYASKMLNPSNSQDELTYEQWHNNKVASKIIASITVLPFNTEFTLLHYFFKYKVDKDSMFDLYDKIVEDENYKVFNYDIPKKYKNAIVGLPYAIPQIKINPHIYFKKLNYKFYLNTNSIEIKLSPKHFAVLKRNKLFIITNNADKLYAEFLKFVDGAKKYVPPQRKPNAATGIYIDEYWKKSFRSGFKKLPDANETIEYITKVYENNGININ